MNKSSFVYEKIQEMNMVNWDKETFDFYKDFFDIGAEILEARTGQKVGKITWEEFQGFQKQWKEENEN
jgi:hypothetical protein